MSFDDFIDLLKRRGVMEKDIELLTSKCHKNIATSNYNELASKCACVFSPPHEGYMLNTWFMSECCFFDAEESINAQVFVMVKKEELKELGISFGGRKVLEKLMEEIRLQ